MTLQRNLKATTTSNNGDFQIKSEGMLGELGHQQDDVVGRMVQRHCVVSSHAPDLIVAYFLFKP